MSESLQQARDSIGSEPDSFPIPIRFINNERVYLNRKITRRRLTDVAIYGNEDLGVYGTSTYHTTETDNFVLGNTTFGVLGSSKLGDNGITDEILYVWNYNNIYIDTFRTSDYIDTTNSTGTLSTSNGTYTLAESKILQSEIIAKYNTTYSKVTITLSGTNTDSATIEVSGDGGTTYETVTDSTEHTFTTSNTDGIKYKITNPTGSGVTITINKIEVRYS